MNLKTLKKQEATSYCSFEVYSSKNGKRLKKQKKKIQHNITPIQSPWNQLNIGGWALFNRRLNYWVQLERKISNKSTVCQRTRRKIILIDITMPPEQQHDILALKERLSAVTTDSKESEQDSLNLLPLETQPSIKALFQKTSLTPSLSAKMTKKAVNWLLSLAWSKDYSFETEWTALMLFYGYRAQKTVNKQTLEPLLLVCLQLATKIHQTAPLKTSELLQCCSKPVEKDVLLEFEGELLELFDFQLCQTNMLERVAANNTLLEEEIMKVLFLAQLYLTRDQSILFDYSKCRRLVQMVKGTDISEGFHLEVLEVQQMAFDPLNRTLCSKFSSKFDVDLFLAQFQ